MRPLKNVKNPNLSSEAYSCRSEWYARSLDRIEHFSKFSEYDTLGEPENGDARGPMLTVSYKR